MPFGIPKSKGGDSPANVRKMESCVSGISGKNPRTGKPYTKSEKIAICKSRLFGNKNQSAKEDYNDIMNQYVSKAIKSGKASNTKQAFAQWESTLVKSNYDINLIKGMYQLFR